MCVNTNHKLYWGVDVAVMRIVRMGSLSFDYTMRNLC